MEGDLPNGAAKSEGGGTYWDVGREDEGQMSVEVRTLTETLTTAGPSMVMSN